MKREREGGEKGCLIHKMVGVKKKRSRKKKEILSRRASLCIQIDHTAAMTAVMTAVMTKKRKRKHNISSRHFGEAAQLGVLFPGRFL
jgi:hypothetical protein